LAAEKRRIVPIKVHRLQILRDAASARIAEHPSHRHDAPVRRRHAMLKRGSTHANRCANNVHEECRA
jgi:hypothetical protein